MNTFITSLLAGLLMSVVIAPEQTGKSLHSIADRFLSGWNAP